MNYLRLLIALIVSIALINIPMTYAQSQGLVTSRACPYSCKSAGLKKGKCRDWREGNRCFVEDLTKKPAKQVASNTVQRGYVTYTSCPHSCKTVGLAKNVCRDWQRGRTCYVEDLTRTPSSKPVPIRPPSPPKPAPPPSYGTDADVRACRELDRLRIAPPRVDIRKIRRSGNFFQSKFRAFGSIEGICLVEAALFEDGRKIRDIRIRTIPEFRRYEFDVQFDRGDEPEIRVYNINGDRDVFDLYEGEREDDRYNDPYQDYNSGWRR